MSLPVESVDRHVQECIEDLQDLRSTAKRVRDNRFLTEKDFQKIRATINDTTARLQIWAPEAGAANVRARKTIAIKLSELQRIIQNADDALKECNQDRSPRKDDIPIVQRLEAAFKEVDKCTQSLQSVSQTSHARPGVRSSFLHHSDLQRQLVRDAQENGGRVRISALDLFWKKIPVIAGSEKEDILDLRDGVMVKSGHLKSASAALKELRQLWTDLDQRFATTWTATHLVEMAKICLILQAIDKRKWIECFIAANKDDSALTLDQQELEAILSHSTLSDDQEEKDEAVQSFLGEQYRVKPREWKMGTHTELHDLEPLPLEFQDSWPDTESGYATVVMVKEVGQGAHVGEIFAHKKGKVKESTLHLTNEFQCLKALGDHTHIVQCVKTYRRGEEFGLLIKPVAEHNLWKLLAAYCDKRYKPRRPVYRKILLRAFGCLSSSLVFIHGTTRHKDIKPQNILWYRPKEADDKRGKIIKSDLSRPTDAAGDKTPRERNIGEVNFLWADFGLAHNFSAKNNAKTYGGHQGTGRYSGPEYRTSDSSTAHDKPSDVFALGCVFLEILSALLKGTLREEDPDNIQQILASGTVPPDRRNQDTNISSATLQESQKQFRHKLPAINDWIGTQLTLLPTDDLLVPLLIESRRMIREKPEKRPEVKEIVQALFAKSDQYFCKECCQQQEALLREANSSRRAVKTPTAQNPSIQPQTAPSGEVPLRTSPPSERPIQTFSHRTSEPQVPTPQASDPKASKPKTSDQKSSDPKATESKATDPKATDPEATESKATESKPPKLKAPELNALEPEIPESKVPKPKVLEPKAPEPKAPESKALEPEAPELGAPESKTPESKAPELKAPKSKALEPPASQPQSSKSQPSLVPRLEEQTGTIEASAIKRGSAHSEEKSGSSEKPQTIRPQSMQPQQSPAHPINSKQQQAPLAGQGPSEKPNRKKGWFRRSFQSAVK